MPRYAILIMGPPFYPWERYGSYDSLFSSWMKEAGKNETWEVFSVYDRPWPEELKASNFAGIVGMCCFFLPHRLICFSVLFSIFDLVTGSTLDAHQRDQEWIRQTEKLCEHAASMHKSVYGSCFGHQLCANAFGGMSHRNPKGLELGSTLVCTIPDAFARTFHLQSSSSASSSLTSSSSAASASSVPSANIVASPSLASVVSSPISSFYAMEVHQDAVLTLPSVPGTQLLAFTDKTAYQMYTINHDVICTQFHPEFTTDVSLFMIDKMQGQGRIPSAAATAIRLQLIDHPPQNSMLQTLIRKFFKRSL